jgi:MoxR-like ATPase
MTIHDAKQILHAAYLIEDTVLIEGAHGIGKSSIVKQYAKETNSELVELFLSHQDVSDLIGMIREVQEAGEHMTVWSKPIWLQRMINAAWPVTNTLDDLSFNDKDFEDFVKLNMRTSSREELNLLYAEFYSLSKNENHLVFGQQNVQHKKARTSVLFLDELNRAPLDVRQSALQLVLERQIHEHKLPIVNGKKTLVVGAINPSDDYQADDLDPALLDRFMTIKVEPDTKIWLDYARERNINKTVRDFIAQHPDRLFYAPSSGKGCTPRAWEKVAVIADNMHNIEANVLLLSIISKIGQDVGVQFYTFLNSYKHIVTSETIIESVYKAFKDIDVIAPEMFDKVVNDTSELISKLDIIVMSELAKDLEKRLINQTKTRSKLPYLVLLHTLPIEILSGYISDIKTRSNEFNLLVNLDNAVTGKKLFRKSVQQLNLAISLKS